MRWADEAMGWLVDKFLIDEVGAELDRLSGVLRTGHLDDRLAAVKQLTFMEDANTVPLLMGALQDVEAPVRGAAANALAYKVSAEAVTPLAVLLSDAEPDVRAKVVEALDEIGLPRGRSWIQFWREKIGTAAEDPRIPDLLGRALTDPHLGVRTAALRVLPRHGARGVAVVRESLELEPGADRPALLDAAEAELVQALKANDAGHRRAAVEALFKLYGERALRPLAETLKDSSADVRRAAVDAVTALGPRPALEELLSRLDDPDEGVVVKVVEGLVLARNLDTFDEDEEDRIHQELLRLARRRDGRAQGVAAWALGEMGRVAAVSALCELLAEPAEGVAVAAAEALGKINDPRAVGPLTGVLEREAPPKAVVAAIRSLARAADVRVIPLFVKRVFSETRLEVEKALEEAITALCGTVEEAARPELQSADVKVRLAAIRRAISEPRLVFALIGQVLDAPSPEVRAAALDVLAKQGFDLTSLARSTLVLADKSEGRRVLAISLIAALQPADAVGALEALLKDANEPPEVYRHAVSALKRLGSESASAALKRHVDHAQEPVREWVRRALE